jgi:tRNA U34 5-carboxymethylaminomethyl modifying GTPase MnmE/TrmE
MKSTKYPITFTAKTYPGKKVFILADFLKWKPAEMIDENGDGTYRYRDMLKPGDYRYRIVADGEELLNPFSHEMSRDSGGHAIYIKHVHDSDVRIRGSRKTAQAVAETGTETMKSVLEKCRESAKLGKSLAEEGVGQIQDMIRTLNLELEKFLVSETETESSYVKEIREKIKKQFKDIQDSFISIPRKINEELDILNKRSSDFTIVLFGRTQAGKSTLMEILTNGNGDSIGRGAQRTTRDVRSYYWNGMEIIDVPGVCAADGGDDEGVALAAVKKADLVLFLIADDSPQPDEAVFLNLIRMQGKPVLGIMNVKCSLRKGWEDDPDYALGRIAERMTCERPKEYERQFNEFLQRTIPGTNVYFLPVHLKAQFESMRMRTDDPVLAGRLSEVSGFEKLERNIINTIKHHGCEYRLKCYLDTVIKPLQECAAELFDQSRTSGEYGRILLQKKRDLYAWKEKEYIGICNAMIDDCVNAETERIKNAIPNFVEQFYDDSKLVAEWKKTVDEEHIRNHADACLKEMLNLLQEKSNSLFDEFRFEVDLVPPVSIPPGEKVTNWKKVWNWGGIATGAIAGIVAICWWNPAGWIALGIGVVTLIGEKIFFEDVEKKRRRARNALQDKLFGETEGFRKKMKNSMGIVLEKKLLKKCYSSIDSSMGIACGSFFELSKRQREIAGTLSRSIVELNGELTGQIIAINLPRSCGDMIAAAGRIPGKITMLLTSALDYDENGNQTENAAIKKELGKTLGTSLKEKIVWAYNSDSTWGRLRHILGLKHEDAKSVLSYEEKINVAHLRLNKPLTPEFHTRILLGQQLTCTPVFTYEETQK